MQGAGAGALLSYIISYLYIISVLTEYWRGTASAVLLAPGALLVLYYNTGTGTSPLLQPVTLVGVSTNLKHIVHTYYPGPYLPVGNRLLILQV